MDITPHISLVRWVANRYAAHAARYRIERDDLVSAGTMGLVRAGELFDPAHGCAFSTYAVTWIKQAIQRYLDNCARLVRIPVHVVGTAEKRAKLEAERLIWLDTCEEPRVGRHDRVTEHSLIKLDVERMVESIASERTRRMVRLYFLEEYTLEEIGAEFGLTRERIRQLVAKGLEEMRASATRAQRVRSTPR